MELQQLKYFCTIAECENLTKAAQKLHVSQPSLSRSLHALEDELGTTLFDRVGRNIVLNNAGRVALNRILAVLDSAESVKREVDEFVHDKNHTVNVYAPVPMGYTDEIITEFKEQYPDIHLRVGSKPSNLLESIQPDITFFASPIVHREPNYLMLGEEDIVLAVSKKNPLANRSSVALSSLSNEHFISVLGSRYSEIVSHMFLEAGFRPNVIIEDQEADRMMGYVARDMGVTLAPAITWFGRWNDKVAALHLSDVHRKRYLYLKWPENTVMSWATLRFREHVINHYNTLYGFSCTI